MFDTFSQVLSFIFAIVSIFQAFYYNRKSEHKNGSELTKQRNLIKVEFSKILSEQIVKELLENEDIILQRIKIEKSLYGKFLRANPQLGQPSENDVNEVISQAISEIDEQRFVTMTIKQKALDRLVSCLQYSNIVEVDTKRVVYSYGREFNILKDNGTYVYSLVLLILYIIYIICYRYNFEIEVISYITTIPIILYQFFILTFFKGEMFNAYINAYIKVHTYINLGLLLVLTLVNNKTQEFKGKLIFQVFGTFSIVALYSLPVIIFILYFIVLIVKKINLSRASVNVKL